MPKQRADRIRPALQSDGVTPALPAVGDALTAVDIGGSVPGCQRIDGSLLLNVQALSNDAPGLYYLGSLLDYTLKSTINSDEVNYTRVRLIAGRTISFGRTFVVTGGAGKGLRAGLYSQTDPTSLTGVPVTRQAQSNLVDTAGITNAYLDLPFTASYLVPTTGYYWIALVTDSSPDLIVTPFEYESNYAPRYEQAGPGAGGLPATASGLTAPKSAILFSAVRE